jgi:hypothetical protein
MRPRRRRVIAEMASRTFDRGGGVPALLVYWQEPENDGRVRERGTKDEMDSELTSHCRAMIL